MLKFVFGLLFGAGAALMYRIASDDSPVTGDTPIDKLKLQTREAKLEGEIAAKEKEAELLRAYDAAVHRQTD